MVLSLEFPNNILKMVIIMAISGAYDLVLVNRTELYIELYISNQKFLSAKQFNPIPLRVTKTRGTCDWSVLIMISPWGCQWI